MVASGELERFTLFFCSVESSGQPQTALVDRPTAHNLDMEKLLDVKRQHTVSPPAYLPEIKTYPTQGPLQARKPVEEVSGKSWYRRALEGTVMSFAVIHTEKETDGRPPAPGKPR